MFANCQRILEEIPTLLKRDGKCQTSLLFGVEEATCTPSPNCGERIRHFTVAYSPVVEHQRQYML